MRRWIAIIGLAWMGATACWAEEGSGPQGAPGITAEQEAQESSAYPDPGGAPSEGEGLPGGGEAPSSREETEALLAKNVSLSFTNANLRFVLSGLAKTYGLNIVADDSVQGTVNLSLRNVPLGDILQQMLKLNGYTTVWEGSIIRVVSREEEEVTESLPLAFIEPDTAMEFLSSATSEGGTLKVDELQNAILVRDKISNIEEMKEVLKRIDTPPQQVHIQAKLLDVTHTDLDNLGLSLSSVSFDIPLRANVRPSLLQIASGALSLPGSSSDLTTDTATATISKGDETLTATLDALIRNRRVKVLASPSIATLNNVEAKIVIGEKFPIAETTQTTTGTLQTTRFVDVGITLRVTPKISRSGFIQMQIHPEVSSVSSTIDAGPRITTREADTTLIIKGGETVLIAGLLQEDETTIKDRIPILGHIPVFGILFQSRSKDYEQKELVIAITPYLLPVEPPQVAGGNPMEAVHRRMDAAQVYYEAQDFEFGKSLQARQMLPEVRDLRAVELYEELAVRFPEHPLAPRALWRAGELSWDRLADPKRSRRAYEMLMTGYPHHRFAKQAPKRVRRIQSVLARQERKRRSRGAEADAGPAQEPPEGSPRKQNFAPYGFR